MQWCVYIVMCEDDGSLYTGITNNITRRLQQHNTGKAAKYTKYRGPVVLRTLFPMSDRSTASKEEYRIKQLSRKDKLTLIKDLEY